MNVEIPKLLKDFLIYISTIKGKAKRTRDEYQYDLVLFLRYLKTMESDGSLDDIIHCSIKDVNIDFIRDITLEDLYSFIEYCENERKNSSYARARKVASIKSFFTYLTKKRRVLTYNPADELETPKLGARNPVYLTLDEAKQFLAGIKETKHYKRNHCIMTLFLNCGIRLSELCHINIDSIKEDTLTVVGKGNKERTIYLNASCMEAIHAYIKEERSLVQNVHDTEALFLSQKGGRLNKRTIQKLVKQINEDSELKKGKLTPHKLRHTAATLIYKQNPDIRGLQYILGHENISTTQIYTHVDSNALRKLVEGNPLNE